MKKHLVTAFTLSVLCSLPLIAENVTVTDDSAYKPDTNAILDVKSTTKGVLVPRVALVSTDDPISGTKTSGLMVYNTSTTGTYHSPGFYMWDGADWSKIGIVGQDVFKWESVTALTKQAESNHGYLINNAEEVTVTLPPTPKVGDTIRITSVGEGGWKLAQNPGQKINMTSVLKNFSFTSKRVLDENGEEIYLYGGVALSDDGSKMAFLDYDNGDRIAISSDFGNTWTFNPLPQDSYIGEGGLVMSADGSKLAAPGSDATGESGVWTSSDSGATWTYNSLPQDSYLGEGGFAMSADGSKLVAPGSDAEGNSVLWTSSDSGTTWIANILGTEDSYMCIYGINISADGNTLIAYDGDNCLLLKSSDFGVTWSMLGMGLSSVDDMGLMPADNKIDVILASDNEDGSVMCTIDGGKAWTDIRMQYVDAATISGDGTVICLSQEGILKIGRRKSPDSGTAGYLTGGKYSSIELQYIGNGEFIPINSYTGNIDAK